MKGAPRRSLALSRSAGNLLRGLAGVTHRRQARTQPARSISLGKIVVNPSVKREPNVRGRLTALQGKVAGADQMAHQVLVDPNRHAPQLTRFRQRCACTRLAAADLKRSTSGGGSRLGNALPPVVADPLFETDWLIIHLR